MIKTISFTGHRPDKFNNTVELNSDVYKTLIQEMTNRLEWFILNEGTSEFISGMAEGVDTIAFFVVHKLKQKYPHIKNICAKPFASHKSSWSETMERLADEVVVVSSCGARYNSGGNVAQQLQLRNEYMVDKSDMTVAVWNGTKGGTYNCISYARKKNKKINYMYITQEDSMKICKVDATIGIENISVDIKNIIIENNKDVLNKLVAMINEKMEMHGKPSVEFNDTPLEKELSRLAITEINEEEGIVKFDGGDMVIAISVNK